MKLAIDTDNKIFALDASLIDFEAWVDDSPSYPTDGLLARYTFDNTLADDYGSNDLSSIDSANWSYGIGKIGQCASVGGGDELEVTLATTATEIKELFYNTTPWTLNFWHRSAWDESAWRSLWCSREADTTNMTLNMMRPGDIKAQYNRGGVDFIQWENQGINDIMFDGDWHMMTMRYDGTTLYWDYDNGTVYSQTLGGTEDLGTTAEGLYFGKARGLEGYPFALDLLYVYNKKISDVEMAELWNGGAGV